MALERRANWLDKAIAETAPGGPPRADFAAWREDHPEAMAALVRRAQRKTQAAAGSPAVIELGRRIMRSPIAKLAAAAALIIGILILANHLTGREAPAPGPERVARAPRAPGQGEASQRELTLAQTLRAEGNIEGLLSLLGTGTKEVKMKVAEYLGEVGDRSVLPALQSFANQWQGAPDANPFQQAIDAIKARQAETEPAGASNVEPNATATNGAPAAVAPLTGVAGKVVEKLTQKPIPGALVGRWRSNDWVTTDASGEFLWKDLRPSAQTYVSVIAKGYASRRIVTRVVEGQITKDILVELDRGSRVEGRVTDSEGNPIAGATVKTFHFTNRPMVTGPDGRFEIDGLSPVTNTYSLHVMHPDYPAAAVRFSPGAVGQTVHQDVILMPGVDIYGRVSDPNGRPVAGVTVGNTGSRAMWNAHTDETDAQGCYRLENVDPGELVVWAVHSDHALHVERVMLTDGISERQIDIQLQVGVPLQGRVVDTAGAPVPNVQVVIHEYNDVSDLDPSRYTSDAEGRFTIVHAPEAGQIVLYPFGDGISGELQKFELGRQAYVLTAKRGGCVYGQVLADRTGEAVPEFTVKMTSTEIGERTHGYAAVWAREGVTFKSPEGLFDSGRGDLPVGAAYRMTVFAPGYDALTLDPVTVQPVSEDPNRTVFRLQPATLIAGLVVDEEGHPVEGVTVAVFSQSERDEPAHWRRFETDASGIFVVAGVANDQRYVYITARGLAPYFCRRSDLETAGDAPVKIVLSPSAAVFGAVVDAAGASIAGARVRLRKEMDPSATAPDYPFPAIGKTTRTDADGNYRLGDLPVGRCRITVRSEAGDTLASKTTELAAGQTMRVDFGKEAGFSITGVVRRGATPVADVDVTLRCSDESTRSARTDGEGRFGWSGVPGGEAKIEVSWDVQVGATGIQRQDLLDRTVVIDGGTELDLDLGAGSVSGSIPETLKGQEGLRIGVRRWADQRARDRQGIVNAWENAHRANPAVELEANGSFHCRGLRAGRYYLVLRNRERVLGITDIFEMRDAEDLRGVAFRAGRGRLDIRILDAQTGRGIDAARFTVTNDLEWPFWDNRAASDGRSSRTVTDAQGKALHEELPAGRYQVCAWALGYLPTRSEFVALSGTGAQPATVALAPAAMATFELSERLRRRVETDSVLIKCRVTDLDTGQSVPSLVGGHTSEEHAVSISLEQPDSTFGSVLHLPEGRYRIDYELRPYNTVRRVVEMPFHKGTVAVDLTVGQPQSVVLEE